MPRDAKAQNGKARRARGSLSEGEILAGATAIVERDGLDGLSMPNLAEHLGAGVMSVYWYFRSKDELMVAMADRAFGEVFPGLPKPGKGLADAELAKAFLSLYRELKRAPVYMELCAANPKLLHPRPSVLPVLAGWFEAVLEVFQRLGLPASDAMRIHATISSYTLGFVLMQLDHDRKSDDPSVEAAFTESVAQLDPAEYPTLRAMKDLTAVVAVNERTFDEGLQLLIAGIDAGSWRA